MKLTRAAREMLRRIAVVGAAALVLGVLLGAGPRRAADKEPPRPSYVVPNIVVGGMSLALLAIACKRFRRE